MGWRNQEAWITGEGAYISKVIQKKGELQEAKGGL